MPPLLADAVLETANEAGFLEAPRDTTGDRAEEGRRANASLARYGRRHG